MPRRTTPRPRVLLLRSDPIPSGYFTPAPPRALAHRGLATEAAENTLAAFAAAVEVGATHIETDVHASRDGVAIISHDVDLARVAGLGARVDSMDADELTRIDLGGGARICTLEEALLAFPQVRLNIDVKSAAAAAPTAAAIRACGAERRVLVTSFSERRRRAAIRGLPGVATSASSVLVALALAAVALRSLAGVRLALRNVDAVQIPERWRGIRIVTPRSVAWMHAAGVEVHVWTVNDQSDMTRLFRLGVDGVVTDRIDLALRII